MLKEFKDFIMTGNVIEFAVAVIMAGAMGAVINGFVADMVMPVVGHLVGGQDFSQLKYVLSEAEVGADGVETKAQNAIMYGKWITSIINLILVGLVMFFIVKAYNRIKPKPAEAPAGPSQEDLLAEIRDLLKK